MHTLRELAAPSQEVEGELYGTLGFARKSRWKAGPYAVRGSVCPLALFIIIFAVNAAKANAAQQKELRTRCIFPLTDGQEAASAMQREYGFLYLGELLERYEERFGMTLPDRRAIALALGYTSDITTPEMFVGSQKGNFIQAVRRHTDAEPDIYLAGALYLIHRKECTVVILEDHMKKWTYTKTEELIFAMSLFPDKEQAFAQLGGQLIDLLGKGRTLPVFGNTDIFNCAFAMLYPLKKQMKARRMDVLRALLSLPVSFVREGNKHHGWLLEHGYTPVEIVYANAAALCSQCVPGGPGRKSLTAEKLIVALFRTVLAYDKALPAEVYEQLSQIYQMYSTFDVKCYGEHRLADTLWEGAQIQTPETTAWFIHCCGDTLHPATAGFDVMESKWDALAVSLDAKVYQKLFASCLGEDMNVAQLQERLDRYRALTQKDYLTWYSEDAYIDKFPLLVKTGIIDLWAAFQSCLSEDSAISKPRLLRHIKEYCRGVTKPQAFEFLKQFLPQYGYQGKESYLDQYQHGFEYELWEQKGYNGGEIILKLHRDFLADDPEGQRMLLHWVDEYFFTENPKRYLDFVTAVLKNEEVAALLSPEDQRGIFDAVISRSKLSAYDAGQLKQRYLTPEEQESEQTAKKAAAEEEKRQEHLKLVQDIEDCYADSSNGTFEAVIKFLNKYRYYSDREKIAHRVVRDGLGQLLQTNGAALAPKEAGRFLDVCGELVGSGTLDWAELQSYILRIKEVKRDDPDSDPDE